MDKLRLRFKKTGRAAYISHLDLMRTMQRAFKRAGLSLKYSEGFNPHPQISIALPLSVGTESVCEIMDFRLESDADLGSLPARLTAAMPEGIEVTDVYEPERKTKDIKWLEVRGRFFYDGRPAEKMAEALRDFFSRDSIAVSKKTKKGSAQTDIAGQIRKMDITPRDGYAEINAVVSAQEPTLNPELLSHALSQLSPQHAPDFADFKRIEVYDGDMEIFR
jgi:radical SAM-linked protein